MEARLKHHPVFRRPVSLINDGTAWISESGL